MSNKWGAVQLTYVYEQLDALDLDVGLELDTIRFPINPCDVPRAYCSLYSECNQYFRVDVITSEPSQEVFADYEQDVSGLRQWGITQ